MTRNNISANVRYLGGIEDELSGVNLSGSANLFTINLDGKKVKILIDFGMFQGGKDDDIYNNLVDKKALEADYIILTHAHIDHAGKIPLLVKNGYKNSIYMTKLTVLQVKEIYLDSIKINRERIKFAVEKNAKITELYNYYFYVIQNYEKLKNGKNNSENRKKVLAKLRKVLKGKDLEKEYLKIKEILERYKQERKKLERYYDGKNEDLKERIAMIRNNEERLKSKLVFRNIVLDSTLAEKIEDEKNLVYINKENSKIILIDKNCRKYRINNLDSTDIYGIYGKYFLGFLNPITYVDKKNKFEEFLPGEFFLFDILKDKKILGNLDVRLQTFKNGKLHCAGFYDKKIYTVDVESGKISEKVFEKNIDEQIFAEFLVGI